MTDKNTSALFPTMHCLTINSSSVTLLVKFLLSRLVRSLELKTNTPFFLRGVYTAFGPNIARQTLVIMLFASGMFSASAAFLPSSFSMYLTMAAYGSWWMGMDYVSEL